MISFRIPVLLAFTLGACFAQKITTIAGTGEDGFSGDGGPAKFAQFSNPRSLAVDGTGLLYVMDSNNGRIRKVSLDGTITTVAGSGDTSSPVEGPAVRSPFIALYDIAVNPVGTLYIADSDGLQKIGSSGDLSFVVSGTSVPGVAITNAGTIYLGGIVNVSRLENDGSMTVLAGTDLSDSGDGGPATSAGFFVTALKTDRAGNIFILDGQANKVRKFTPGGIINTVAGTGVADFAGDGGPANRAILNAPNGLAVDVAGNIYISDTGNHRIRKVTTDGVINTIAGQTDSTDPGDDGPALQAYLNSPTNLAVSCTALYVTDSYRIRAIPLTSPLIAQGGVLPAAASSATIKAGDQFTISGCNLAMATVTADPNLPLPATLGGASVAVNGQSVGLVSVSPTKITVRLPANPGSGTGSVVVSVDGNGTASSSIIID